MQLSDNFEIKCYKDFLENQTEVFRLIEDVMEEAVKDMAKRNPTFLISHYNEMVNINEKL